jgi:hypothetical protein
MQLIPVDAEKVFPFKERRIYTMPYNSLRSAIQSVVLNEELPTKEIDPKEFPNPVTDALKKVFTRKGKMDGDTKDDVVNTRTATWKARKLNASQDAVYLGKALGMAIGGVNGGDLGAIVSQDRRILDGHHRWAATILNNPEASITGIEAKLKIGDLVPVLRALGDVLGNARRGQPKGGDINFFKASSKDALEAINTGKNMDSKYYNKDKAIKWLESIGGESVLKERMAIINRSTPPKGAPPRDNMPVIDADKAQHTQAADLLKKGNLDVRKPYAKVK